MFIDFSRLRGECMLDFAAKDPGPLNYSKWLLGPNRVLRFYIFKTNSSYEFKILARYIMKMYVLIWFNVKGNYSVMYGPTHIFKVIQTTQQMSDNLRRIIDSVIQIIAFFSLPRKYVVSNGSR